MSKAEKMFSLIKYGKREKVYKELQKFDPNTVDKNGTSALMVAAEHNKNDIIKILLAAGAKINHQRPSGATALVSAVYRSHYDTMELLVSLGADVNAGAGNDFTALHWAAYHGRKDMTEFLIRHGANVNVYSKEGRSPLSCSAAWHIDIVKMLVAAGADFNRRVNNGSLPLEVACKDANFRIAKFLIDAGADVNSLDSKNWSPLHHAAQINQVAIADYLLRNGARFDVLTIHGETPILLAAWKGKLEIIKLLVKAGADINAVMPGGLTALSTAQAWRNQNVVNFIEEFNEKGFAVFDDEKTFYSQGFDVETYFGFVRGGYYTKVWDYLNKGVSLDTRNEAGATALIVSAFKGHLNISLLLIERGIDIDAQDNNGFTALMTACEAEYEDPDLVRLLIAGGANVNQHSEGGSTALMAAAKFNHFELTKLLISNGADINAKNQHGVTPLIWAANNGNRAIVNLLINAGADIMCLTDNGYTAETIASENGHHEIAQLLKDACSNIAAVRALSGIGQEQPESGNEVPALIAELIMIGRTDGFLSMQPGGKFNQEMRHIRACEIGERLNTIGGIELMREIGYTVAQAFPGAPHGRELEAAWVGIGQWL